MKSTNLWCAKFALFVLSSIAIFAKRSFAKTYVNQNISRYVRMKHAKSVLVETALVLALALALIAILLAPIAIAIGLVARPARI